jgi:hypothetical protein
MTLQVMRGRNGGWASLWARGVLGAAALGMATVAACGGSTASVSSTPSSGDPAKIANQLWTQLDAGDAAGATALVSPTATWQGGPGCAPAPCVGAAQIGTSFGMRVAAHAHILVSNLRSSGSVATFTLQVASDRIAAAGVSRIIVNDTMTVSQGKVTDVKEIFDMTDAQTAAYVQFSQTHPAPHA